MPIPKRFPGRLIILVLLGFTVSQSAHAYIDPNAGGMLFQLLAPIFAAVVGAWLFLRRWIGDMARRVWRRLLGRTEE